MVVDVPKLPPYTPEKTFDEFEEDNEEEEKPNFDETNRFQEDNEEETKASKKKRNYKPAAPEIIDPYANDETSYLLPIIVAIGAFIPLVYCLCKL